MNVAKTAVKATVWGLFALLMLGCKGSSKGEEDASATTASHSSKAVYVAPEPGFIKSPGFQVNEQGRLIDWKFSQHSSNTSYRTSVTNGVLSIARTGAEPWGKVDQIIKGNSLKPLLGKTLVFSADIKSDFTGEWGLAMEPPAVFVSIKGLPKGAPALLGASLLKSIKEPVTDLSAGLVWTRYQLKFSVPSSKEAKVTVLELGFLMTEGGTMSIRGPALIEVE
ncbi:hypothetical protein KO507_12065 [Gilvimarinus agarilyticus]|uniref:hypothetical protein n=1 Tax=Gilvimarinus sp. 2_MG-2023 TaxID=3062666 RepID=UPI001C08D191|nr:hypothetical protein [Gilvimarinus sp. 2_MG-2023]MBU2886498.1 hypothetical protein [Gilvimarinus agarilyticus]MDO6571166.1 hypothetical protein [Gilvimarinus sp. 2_MG-2023]